MSLAGKNNFENVLFLTIMEHTSPFKICFSEEQKSFSLGKQCGLIILFYFSLLDSLPRTTEQNEKTVRETAAK